MDFKKGDQPKPGLTITKVIEGNNKDSFSHYIYRRNDNFTDFESKVPLKQIYVNPAGHVITNPTGELPRGYQPVPVDEIRVVGNPEAARIWFDIQGEPKGRCLKPDEFKEFLDKYNPDDYAVKIEEPVTAPEPVNEDELKANADAQIRFENMPAEYLTILGNGGIKDAKGVLDAGIEGLVKIRGIGEARAKEILGMVKG